MTEPSQRFTGLPETSPVLFILELPGPPNQRLCLSAQRRGREADGEHQHQQPRRARRHAGRRLRAFLLARPVAERRVAAGDAHRVELAGAELLVAGGGDQTGSRRGAGLAVVHP